MSTSTVVYLDTLRTEATHIQSGTSILTDAPTDNQGKGQYFSPTDLLATSLASCMLTIMGIAANNHRIQMGLPEAEVLKVMASSPRRVQEIQILIHFPQSNLSEKSKSILEKAALSCPVALSLNEEIKQKVSFKYG